MEAPYILVVDDVVVNRRLVAHALSPLRVAEAGDAAEALRAVFRTPPAVIVLDLNLPEVDGLTVLRLVRQEERRRQCAIPVIVVSGQGTRERVEEAARLGIQGFFVKPLNPQALRERVLELAPRPLTEITPDAAP